MASGIDYPKNTRTKNQPDGINHDRGRRLGMGVDALSVTPPAIPAAKEAVRAVDTVDAQRIVRKRCLPATARRPCGRG
jgi:hypothetical protein